MLCPTHQPYLGGTSNLARDTAPPAGWRGSQVPAQGEFQTQRSKDLRSGNSKLWGAPPFLHALLFQFVLRVKLGFPLLQEALPDVSSLHWSLPFPTPFLCSVGHGGVEEGARDLVAESWGFDLLCHPELYHLVKVI